MKMRKSSFALLFILACCSRALTQEGNKNRLCKCYFYALLPLSPSKACTVEGEVRLVDVFLSSLGRLELCVGGEWRRISANGFDVAEAGVACRQLGFSRIGLHRARDSCMRRLDCSVHDHGPSRMAADASTFPYPLNTEAPVSVSLECLGGELALPECQLTELAGEAGLLEAESAQQAGVFCICKCLITCN